MPRQRRQCASALSKVCLQALPAPPVHRCWFTAPAWGSPARGSPAPPFSAYYQHARNHVPREGKSADSRWAEARERGCRVRVLHFSAAGRAPRSEKRLDVREAARGHRSVDPARVCAPRHATLVSISQFSIFFPLIPSFPLPTHTHGRSSGFEKWRDGRESGWGCEVRSTAARVY
jgi:hypothetical protein